jgi:hypothetical protein
MEYWSRENGASSLAAFGQVAFHLDLDVCNSVRSVLCRTMGHVVVGPMNIGRRLPERTSRCSRDRVQVARLEYLHGGGYMKVAPQDFGRGCSRSVGVPATAGGSEFVSPSSADISNPSLIY